MKRLKPTTLRCVMCGRIAKGFIAGHAHCGRSHYTQPPKENAMVRTTDKVTTLKRLADTQGKWYSDDGYSGRMMFGTHCAAIACEVGDAQDLIREAKRRGIDGGRIDSLGKGAIVYWPKVVIRAHEKISGNVYGEGA